ncbi:MAG: TIGR02677 family protein [Acidimicrobiales bacterium]|nr:TIGR02677 family protein [Acidimicrobiales bacterium]
MSTYEPSPADTPADTGRSLFRYVVGDEWADYRAIMAVFADTFFTEFSPDDVARRLADAGHPLGEDVVADRLESLRRWGNLAVSSSVGNPTSLTDYYRRRNRYLITRAGQEVHQVVEGILTRVDEVADVSTGRLRTLLDALVRLAAVDPATIDETELSDLVGAVFDPHQAFTSEITQFFAAINQWQSRYDLSPDELRFFAEVLVGYVGERLDDIERTARPISRRLIELEPSFPTIVERAEQGLASRVDRAGFADEVRVGHRAGSRLDDWDHLCSWFVRSGGRPSRIETLTRDAVAAVRTLTLNLTRLSRAGAAAASRRADLLRLAQLFGDAEPDQLPRLAAAAFGIGPTNHYGVLAADAGDPVATTTPWADAPPAEVPMSIRRRGDTTNRGRPSPVPDRSQETALLRQRRAEERAARTRIDHELLDLDELDGSTVSVAALTRLQEIVGRTLTGLGTAATGARRDDGPLTCHIERTPGRNTRVSCPDGTLALLDLTVALAPRFDTGTDHARAG